MEKRNILEKITSKYIIQNIFNYISNDLIKYKLFIHSIKFKECLNIQLFDYQDKYFNKIKFNFKDYCKVSNDISNKQYNLKNKLNEFLSKNNLNFFDFQSYIVKYFLKNEKYLKQKYKKNKIIIDISSPLINILLNNPLFKDVFLISIPFERIFTYNYIEDYITFFDSIKNKNILYGLIIEEFVDEHVLYYIDIFKVDFNQVKTFVIREKCFENKINYGNFFKKFFSFNIYNTLVNLEIKFSSDFLDLYIEDNVFENINALKAIEYLKLESLRFESNFILKLNNIKKLHLFFCKNISLFGDYYNLKELNLKFNKMEKSNTLIKCQNIEICKINYFLNTAYYLILQVLQN